MNWLDPRRCTLPHPNLMTFATFSLLLLLIVAPRAIAEGEETARVGRIRAALLYYVVKFVAFDPSVTLPIKLCIIGEDALNTHIKGTMAGKSVSGRPLEVQLLDEWQNSSNCQVAFFAAGSVQTSILRSAPRNLLTICAVKEVSWDSCMVQIFVDDNKARLAVDLDQVRDHGLEVGSELLEVAVTKKAKE